LPYNPKSNARLNEFLEQLANNGIIAISSKRSVYNVSELKVSIRTTTKPGPVYWYDVSKNIINSVDYFIYQMDSRHNFILFPSSLFKDRYQKLKDSNRANAKTFYLDWKNKTIVSKPNYEEDIQRYCCSTVPDNSYGNWKSHLIIFDKNNAPVEHSKKIILNSPNCFDDIETHKETFIDLEETERKRIIDSRVGQNVFRDKLIKKWGGCSVTGYKQVDLLIAAHIKPWSSSDNFERLDVNNGLLLIPNLDSLFDKGYISFLENGLIQYSHELDSASANLLGVNKKMVVRNLNEDNLKYLNYHRKHVFKA